MNKKGTIETMRYTIQNRGFLGLYKGYSALLFFSVPKNTIRFATYNYLKTYYFKENKKVNNFISGLMAGAVESTFVVTP